MDNVDPGAIGSMHGFVKIINLNRQVRHFGTRTPFGGDTELYAHGFSATKCLDPAMHKLYGAAAGFLDLLRGNVGSTQTRLTQCFQVPMPADSPIIATSAAMSNARTGIMDNAKPRPRLAGAAL